jgi:hypothetical protein
MLAEVRFYAAAAVLLPLVKITSGALAIFDCMLGIEDDA